MDSAKFAKIAAARAAVALVQDGMTLGVGTGSTAEELVRLLAQRVRHEGLRLQCVATSKGIEAQLRALGLELLPGFPDFGEVDLALDGADEVDPTGGLLKGGGGALLCEKLVAGASSRFVVMIDSSKRVQHLGEKWSLPVEIVPFGWSRTLRDVVAMGAQVKIREAGEGSFQTDRGNLIFDCKFGPIADPRRLHTRLKLLPGVVETGLFLGMTDQVLCGMPDGTCEITNFTRAL